MIPIIAPNLINSTTTSATISMFLSTLKVCGKPDKMTIRNIVTVPAHKSILSLAGDFSEFALTPRKLEHSPRLV